MNELVHKYLKDGTAVNIAEGLEQAIRDGKLEPGQKVPTIRALAHAVNVSPTTIAAAYRNLRSRGILVARGRGGTRVSHRPMHAAGCKPAIPHGVRDLSDGNPDPQCLPDLKPILQRIDAKHVLYGSPTECADLVKAVKKELNNDDVVTGDVCILSGAMDAIERLLTVLLKPGDRVGVEDPGFGSVFTLAMSRGLSLVPLPVDEQGMKPEPLAKACRESLDAIIVTPRAQTPTGACLTDARAAELKRIIRRYPDLIIIEDDHANLVSHATLHRLHDEKRRTWAHVRSFAKSMGPDIRLAAVTGDDRTIARVRELLVLGCRWVSYLLQRTVCELLSDKTVRKQLVKTGQLYAQRRNALVSALAKVGLQATACSGFNVWLPVPAEATVVQSMLAAGWSVAPGERFRITSPPGIRITTATLEPELAARVADDLHNAVKPNMATNV